MLGTKVTSDTAKPPRRRFPRELSCARPHFNHNGLPELRRIERASNAAAAAAARPLFLPIAEALLLLLLFSDRKEKIFLRSSSSLTSSFSILQRHTPEVEGS